MKIQYLDQKIYQRICEKKKRLDSLRPISSSLLQKLREQVILELTYHSNAIEGNTLTLRETQLVIEEGLTIAGKSLREHLEAINHKEATEFIFELAKDKKPLSSFQIRQIHQLILAKIDNREAGKYRTQNVKISGSQFIPPDASQVPALMNRFDQWLKENYKKLDPLEFSALAHFRLVHIHPFTDGNGRTVRLLTNLILIKNGYPITIILKTDRKEYYQALEKGHKGYPRDFVNFMAKIIDRQLSLWLSFVDIKRPKNRLVPLKELSSESKYSQEYLSLLARKRRLEAFKINDLWYASQQFLENYEKSLLKKK